MPGANRRARYLHGWLQTDKAKNKRINRKTGTVRFVLQRTRGTDLNSKLMTVKDVFAEQLTDFVTDLKSHISTEDGQWTVKGFIDIYI
jgi:hypothetical protein